MTNWTTKTLTELIDSVNDVDDPIDIVLESCLDSVKRVIESVMEMERDIFCGIARSSRGDSRKDYRNGYYERDYETCFGVLEKLRIPRTRCGRFRSILIERFARREKKVSDLIRSMFLCGVSSRDVSEVLKPFLGIEPSASTVSRIARSVDEEVHRFKKQAISDEYEYLLLDGIALRVKTAPYAVGRCALVAMGIRSDGSKKLLSFRIEHSESEACWERLLNDLYRRGLVGENLKLIISDGGPGLIKSLGYVYPDVAHQRCWVHKMRNIAARLKRSQRKPCLEDVKKIWNSATKREAEIAYRHWEAKWKRVAPEAVECIKRDLEELLVFLEFPKEHWPMIRTTNYLERCFREFRRRLRPIGCMKNYTSCERMIYSICKRLNLRWQAKRKPSQNIFTQAA